MLLKYLWATAALLTACAAVPFPKDENPASEKPSVQAGLVIVFGNSTEDVKTVPSYGGSYYEGVFDQVLQTHKAQGPWSHIGIQLDKAVKNKAQRCTFFNEDDDPISAQIKDKTENLIPDGIWKLTKPSLIMRFACDCKYGSTPDIKFNQTATATVTFSDEKGVKKMRRTFNDRLADAAPFSVPIRGPNNVGPWAQVEMKVSDAVKDKWICIALDKDGKTIEVSKGADTEQVFWDDRKGPWKLKKPTEVHRYNCSPEDFVPQPVEQNIFGDDLVGWGWNEELR